MRKIYPIGHWFLTILFAPFVEQAIIYLYTPKPHLVAGLVEVYPITLLFSITFSLPALLLSWVLFYSLTKFDFDYHDRVFHSLHRYHICHIKNELGYLGGLHHNLNFSRIDFENKNPFFCLKIIFKPKLILSLKN